MAGSAAPPQTSVLGLPGCRSPCRPGVTWWARGFRDFGEEEDRGWPGGVVGPWGKGGTEGRTCLDRAWRSRVQQVEEEVVEGQEEGTGPSAIEPVVG